MSRVSTVQKLGVVARVAAQQVKRSRTVRAARGLSRHGARLRTGAAPVMAGGYRRGVPGDGGEPGIGSVKEYGKYHAGQAGLRGVVACNLLHSDVRVVRGEFVLEGEEEGEPVMARLVALQRQQVPLRSALRNDKALDSE